MDQMLLNYHFKMVTFVLCELHLNFLKKRKKKLLREKSTSWV